MQRHGISRLPAIPEMKMSSNKIENENWYHGKCSYSNDIIILVICNYIFGKHGALCGIIRQCSIVPPSGGLGVTKPRSN